MTLWYIFAFDVMQTWCYIYPNSWGHIFYSR